MSAADQKPYTSEPVELTKRFPHLPLVVHVPFCGYFLNTKLVGQEFTPEEDREFLADFQGYSSQKTSEKDRRSENWISFNIITMRRIKARQPSNCSSEDGTSWNYMVTVWPFPFERCPTLLRKPFFTVPLFQLSGKLCGFFWHIGTFFLKISHFFHGCCDVILDEDESLPGGEEKEVPTSEAQPGGDR